MNTTADVVRPALQFMVKRLRTITERADDSGGTIGYCLDRAVGLHARSCIQGNPDPVKLARWLVSYRRTSPGWPETPLEMYVGAFDDRALAAYRKGVAKIVSDESCSVFNKKQLLLELADYDNDVDQAVEILSLDEIIEYRSIVDRLRASGRFQEAMEWTEKAIEAGRVRVGGKGGTWLTPAYAGNTLPTCRNTETDSILHSV